MKQISLLLTAVLCTSMSFAQASPPKQVAAKRTNRPVKIDGNIDEDAWKDAALLTDFVEYKPVQFRKEEEATRTVAYLMYNDEGIYFGGHCYERSKDSISAELKGRDGFGNNDFIGIIFDTYKDHLNGFEYFVTPLGEQFDAKQAPNINGNNEDFSWNAVWHSAAVIHEDGWSFEFFIPYAAIRFGKKNIQDWGLNIIRRKQKSGRDYMWNPVDQNVNGFLTQEGYWTGIENIKPPLRLQFSPYFSVYANHFPANQPGVNNWTSQVNGGMDLKYGINQAFTLDATLIPDFGQVQSDNQVLNLTPFEVKFNENRSFFTEGTELFSKGNLFYSRRIGGSPIHQGDVYGQLGTNEYVVKNPTESKLINASKISGRTQKGLGIGFLNAITEPTTAIVEDNITKSQRRVETDPLTNYNVLVLDQTLKHNSSVSLVNTNVWRSGKDYDANVTAALFDLNDKKNMWNVGGKLAASNLIGYLPGGKNLSGYTHSFYFGKTSGRFNFNVWQDLTDTKFSSNDLGYFTNNNYLDHGIWMGTRWLKPKSFYNRIFLNFNFMVSKLYKKIDPVDQSYQRANFNFNANLQTKSLWWIGAFMGFNFRENDFYEPRTTGWFFRRNFSNVVDLWVNSNEAKKYSFSVEAAYRHYYKFYNSNSMDLTIAQKIRFSKKFSIDHQIMFQPRFNNMGYTAMDNNDIVFARRDRNTIENILSLKYSFTTKMFVTFRARHYLSTVENKEFFTLLRDGGLAKNNSYASNRDQSVNFFNIDMVYTWQFAPGSFINIVWKNSTFDYRQEAVSDYFKNFRNTIESNQNNNLSLKVIYFLDYADFKKKLKKKA